MSATDRSVAATTVCGNEGGKDMPAARAKTYKEGAFDHLKRQSFGSPELWSKDFHAIIDWSIVERRLREEAAVRPTAA